MLLDLSKLSSIENEQLLEPRDIFMALPEKSSNYGYPRDVQTEVWKQWFEQRNNKNNIIKMNTGSGKTVVGLTILQSCLNEGKGPVVYVVPDKYLVNQVCKEAKKLGINVSYDKVDHATGKTAKGEDDYLFASKNSILVTNIHKLFNGKSVFGLRSDNNIPVGSILIDDVHSCMDIIEQQSMIFIEKKSELYSSIIELFSKYQEIVEHQSFYEITINDDPSYNYLVPFWIWQEKSLEIYRMLSSNKEESLKNIRIFNLPFLKDNWKTVNCVISSRGVELTLKGIPIDKITSFANAERRIFMSATLADDSVFISTIGLKKEDISPIITPEKASDIGDRLILIPKHINSMIDDNEIKNVIVEMSKKVNVVVIVPSQRRVSFWQDVNPYQILTATNIEEGVQKLKEEDHVGLTILVNKYDGIDLPDNACRILVIDGLPTMRTEYEKAICGMNPNDKRILCSQIQKIEQGMGRGVRSNNDYCTIVFMGNKLSNIIVNQGGKEFFSSVTQKQFSLSEDLWNLFLKNRPKDELNVANIFMLSDYILNRDPEWIKQSKAALSNLNYDKSIKVDSIVVAQREAFEKESLERYDEAFAILETEKNKTSDRMTKGLLMQYMAEYKNFINPAQSQELLLSARKLNGMVLKTKKGIGFEKILCSPNGQEANILKYYVENKFGLNDYIIHVDSILDDLCFSQDNAHKFEEALKNIATIIGISSSRPEHEYGGKAPDNLLALSQSEYAIIECKSRSTALQISKDDCGQLLQSIQWFKNHYVDSSLIYHPILIHNSSVFGKDASPSKDMRVMTPLLLEDFRKSVRTFCGALVRNDIMTNMEEVKKLLVATGLNTKSLVNKFTEDFQVQK